MTSIICLISAFGIAFFIKESDIFNPIRVFLIDFRPSIFYRLLNCYFCLGFWASLGTYFAQFNHYRFIDHLLWSFAGAGVSLLLSAIIFKQDYIVSTN